MAETYQCRHCWSHVPYSNGADDDIERMIGPICDDCASVAVKILDGIKPTLPIEFTISDALIAYADEQKEPIKQESEEDYYKGLESRLATLEKQDPNVKKAAEAYEKGMDRLRRKQ